MAGHDDDDDNVVPFQRYEVTLEEDLIREADMKTGFSYFLEHYDNVIVIGYDGEDSHIDIVENMGDAADLYELLQQAAANVALEAIELAFKGTAH